MRQLIIARKDLNMSPGKLAAQCCHASMAFMTWPMRNENCQWIGTEGTSYKVSIEPDIYKEWICGRFTKTVCEAKNKNHLLKVIEKAKELGLKENVDYFLIKDACLTELTPEEVDENGVGRTLTCIGFKPLSEDISHQLSKKYQLYK